jgi:uncharacterized membrane protein
MKDCKNLFKYGIVGGIVAWVIVHIPILLTAIGVCKAVAD